MRSNINTWSSVTCLRNFKSLRGKSFETKTDLRFLKPKLGTATRSYESESTTESLFAQIREKFRLIHIKATIASQKSFSSQIVLDLNTSPNKQDLQKPSSQDTFRYVCSQILKLSITKRKVFSLRLISKKIYSVTLTKTGYSQSKLKTKKRICSQSIIWIPGKLLEPNLKFLRLWSANSFSKQHGWF